MWVEVKEGVEELEVRLERDGVEGGEHQGAKSTDGEGEHLGGEWHGGIAGEREQRGEQ